MRSDSSPTIAGRPLTLRFDPRARRLRLRADPRGRGFSLTVPPRISARRAIAWASEQGEWAEAMLARMPGRIAIEPGCTLPFLGAARRVDWEEGRPRTVEPSADCLSVGGPRESLERRILRWLRGEALARLTAETHALAAAAGLKLRRVSVGDPVSRWGSCSAAGAIRYSWRLVMAPDFVRRATVAHEVAHLAHLHHGPDFHNLVNDLLGTDPAPARAWLRRHGAGLHRIGASGPGA